LSIVVVATLHPLPGKVEAVADAMRTVIPAVHQEDGCELYAMHSTKDSIVMVEQWASREALAVHAKAAALASLAPLLEGLVSGPATVVVTQPLPAGEPSKGIVRSV
jgi:quinol monooxygenase YgiN